MCNDLVRNPAGVAPGPCGIKTHRTVVALWFWLWNRPDHRSAARLRFSDRWCWPWRPRASTAGRRYGRLLIYLLSRDFRSNQEAGIIRRYHKLHAGMKAAIASGRFIEALRIGEGVLFPRQQREPGANRVQENCCGLQPRQVEVAAEIVSKLPDCDVVPTPQRHSVQLHAEARGRKVDHQQFIILQLLAGPLRERVLPR